MKKGLEKIVKKIILPKYPFITDYEVVESDDDVYKRYNAHYYRVNLFIDEYMLPVDFPLKNIIGEVENLFEILGPNDDEKLEGTEFYRSK